MADESPIAQQKLALPNVSPMPSADPAGSATADISITFLPALQDGEIILLMIKPSTWSVLVSSLPTFGVLGLLWLATAAAPAILGLRFLTPRQAGIACISLGMLRLLLAAFAWMARMYLLTNRRVIRVSGLTGGDVRDCLLKQVRQMFLFASGPERLFGLASLYFRCDCGDMPELSWTHLGDAQAVQEAIEKAIRNAH